MREQIERQVVHLSLFWNMKGKKRRGTWLVIAAVFLLFSLTGCGGSETVEEVDSGKLKIVTTLFPYYDFTRQIAGDHVELSLIIPAGMDSHSFEPTPSDIRMIEGADILIANGGHMEHWVEEVVDSLGNEDLQVVYMMDHVDVVAEEVVEGMEHNHDHSHVHADGEECTEDHDHELLHGHDAETCTDKSHDHDHDEETCTDESHDHEDESQYEIEYDEHIWTSPVNAMEITDVIAETLKAADPVNAEIYDGRKDAYIKELEAIDAKFREIREEAVHDIMIMGDKFPLRYFADEYDLRYRAAFSGCSSDTEPSAKTIAYLIDKMKEEQLPAIFYLELSSHRVSEIIGEETGATPLLFHSCHNVTRREFEEGITYLQLMEQNVINLREGLCK